MNIIFAKYNRSRLPRFQTETSIVDGNPKWVIKRALHPAAQDHIDRTYANFLELKKSYPDLAIVPAQKNEDVVYFQFIEGPSLEDRLIQLVRQQDRQGFSLLLQTYIDYLSLFNVHEVERFVSDDAFSAVFGLTVAMDRVKVLPRVNIDASFENLLFNDRNHFVLIDYEWTFDFAAPVDYVIYRSLRSFYIKFAKETAAFWSRDELFASLDIDRDKQAVFEEMEEGFQNYVLGKDQRHFNHYRYMHPPVPVQDLIKLPDQVNELVHWAKSLEQSVLERDEFIKKQTASLLEVSEWAHNLQNTIQEKEAALAEPQQKLEELSVKVASMEQQLLEKEQHIAYLEQKVPTFSEWLRAKINKKRHPTK